MLPDGRYDAVIVDASTPDPDDPGTVAIELTVLAGAHKGEMVTVQASGLERDALDLLAVPATLTVSDGRPTLALEG
jgi:hypothetical protein